MSPVCFTREDQRPSLDLSGLVSIGASEEEIAIDDSMSLTASDADECVCSGEEPEAPPPSAPSVDSELIHVLTRAVEELGLAWSAVLQVFHAKLVWPGSRLLLGVAYGDRSGPVCYQGDDAGSGQGHGQPGGAGVPSLAKLDGHQGC